MTSRERRVTGTLVQLADTLVAGYDVAEMFYYLVESCIDVLSIDHAGLMLVDADGNLHVVAATSEVTHLIELLQIQNQEGPCLDAFRSGLVVESGPLTDSEVRARWPRFTEAANDAGFGAITAMPMRLRDQVLGALNLFRVETAPLTADDLSVARAFANIATISILQARATHDARTVIDQLQRALDTRVIIESQGLHRPTCQCHLGRVLCPYPPLRPQPQPAAEQRGARHRRQCAGSAAADRNLTR